MDKFILIRLGHSFILIILDKITGHTMLDNGPHLPHWDVLALGTFCLWDVLSQERCVPWDVLSLVTFFPWDVLSSDVLYVHQTI